MRQKTGPEKQPAEETIKDIRRATMGGPSRPCRKSGQLDNTLVIDIEGDNGASAEARRKGRPTLCINDV